MAKETLGAKAKIEEFGSFLGTIPKKARIALFFDTDPDGITAAVIAACAIREMRGRLPEEIVPLHHSDFGEFGKIYSKYKFDYAIILDLPLDSIPKAACALEKKAKILNIDHHKFYSDISSRKTLLIKPQMISSAEPSRYPTAKMCFDLFSQHAGISERDWIACIGIIGDHAWDEWREFIGKTAVRWKIKKDGLFGANNVVSAFLSMNEEGAKEIFDFLLKAKGPKEFLKSRFAGHVEKFEREVEREIGIAKKKAEHYKKAGLIFYCFRPKFSLKHAIISGLSNENPGKTVVVVADGGRGALRASARRPDFKISMAELMEQAVKGMKGARGGGHVPAAGATIPRKQLEQFRRNLIKILSENPPKVKAAQKK